MFERFQNTTSTRFAFERLITINMSRNNGSRGDCGRQGRDTTPVRLVRVSLRGVGVSLEERVAVSSREEHDREQDQ